MKKLILLGLCLFSFQLFADSSKIDFSNGWIKYLPPVVPMRAGYVEIENPTTQDIEITAIQSDAFEKIELHETINEGGMMKMIQLDTFNIPAKSKVQLRPGGKHMMLINPLIQLDIGNKVDLIVTFSDEKAQNLTLKVKQ